jgi:AraC-like DNA-binding protein
MRFGHDIILINRHMTELNPLFIGEERCVRGKSYGPAVRRYALIHYVVSGKGYLQKGDTVYTVQSGEAFLISPDEITTYWADNDDPWHYQWVAFDGSLIEKFRELSPVLHFHENYIRRMLEVDELSATREYRICSYLFQMYADIFDKKRIHNHYVRQVQDHINTLYMKDISVEQIAEKLNLDRRYLTRLFKQKTGMTIQEYLIQVRMEEAKRQLLAGMTVAESATLCGYEDVCNFSKMFKKAVGCSPTQWKKQM